VTRSITREAAALVTNDMARAYRPSRTELAMMPYYGTLAFLAKGDLDGAVVEARRLALRLEESEQDATSDERSMRAALRLLTASVFEAAGEWNDAAVARRHVVALTGDSSFAPSDGVPTVPDDSVDVLVVVEHGFAPHRVAQRAVLGLRGDVGTVLQGITQQDARGGVFGMGSWRSNGWWWDDRTVAGGVERDLRNLTTLAWPVLAHVLAPAPMQLAGGETPAGAARLLVGDVGASIAAEYRRALPGILTRVAARAIARRGALELIQGGKGKRRGVATAAAVATAALDLADTRSWSALPNGVGVQRVRVPRTAGQLRVWVGGGLASIALPPSRSPLRLAHHRAYDRMGTPLAALAAIGTVP
jgi:hypothetical protein